MMNRMVYRFRVRWKPPSLLNRARFRAGFSGFQSSSRTSTPIYITKATATYRIRLAFWPYFWLVRTVSTKKGALNT